MSRPFPQQIYITARPVFTILTSLDLRTENTGIGGEWIFMALNLTFTPTKSNYPERFFIS